jgi:DNA-directed RNA polymerase specialized sigma24 family protein
MMTTPDDRGSEHFSAQEVARAFSRLGRADIVRLSYLSRIWAKRVDASLADDLLNEAIARALSGRRRWPTVIDLATFMAQSMRSIAHEWRLKRMREVVIPVDDIALLAPIALPVQEVEAGISQVRDRVAVAFEDDPLALAIFTARLEDQSPSATRERLAIDATQYDTALRRMQRRLAQLFPEGPPV